jgi:integrase
MTSSSVVSATVADDLRGGIGERPEHTCGFPALGRTGIANAITTNVLERTREIAILGASAVEALRASLLAHGSKRDATLVSVLAYAGLRPGQALALTWATSERGPPWLRARSR